MALYRLAKHTYEILLFFFCFLLYCSILSTWPCEEKQQVKQTTLCISAVGIRGTEYNMSLILFQAIRILKTKKIIIMCI